MSLLKDRLAKAMQGPPSVTAAELARACGVKPPSVSDWLSGRTKGLRGSNLYRAANLLGVSPLWLGEGRGPMRPKEGSVCAPLYEDQLSPRALRLVGQLLQIEQDSRATDHLYRVLENALALAGASSLTTPVTDTTNIAALCDRLPAHQRDALAAFLSSLTE